jgi:hypothetical protein
MNELVIFIGIGIAAVAVIVYVSGTLLEAWAMNKAIKEAEDTTVDQIYDELHKKYKMQVN